MTDDSISGYTEIRRAMLAFNEPRSVADIFDACDSIARHSDVASMMHVECAAGRVERTGEKGGYKYQLTESGRAAAENPRLLRGRRNRRVRGRGLPPLPSPPPRAEPAPAAPPSPPASDPNLDGIEASGWIAPAEIRASLAVAPNLQDDTDRGVRLAAAVLTHWPTHIRTMPEELRQAVQASIAPAFARA